jgi:hypothetical protein
MYVLFLLLTCHIDKKKQIDRRASQLERREYRLAEKRHGQNQRAAAFAEAHGRPPESSDEARAWAAAKAVEEFKRREVTGGLFAKVVGRGKRCIHWSTALVQNNRAFEQNNRVTRFGVSFQAIRKLNF